MTDNVTVSNSPTSINTDIPVRTTQTADNKHIQHMRLDIGDGAAESLVSDLNPLPVSGTVTLDSAGLATEAKQTVGNTSLSNLDAKTTACNTGAVTISTALPAGNNNIGDIDVATLPNVTLASQANPFSSAIPVSDNGGSITVDGTVTIGTALPAGTNNIGDVDVLTLPSVTLASQANPFSSAIPVSDNGGSITVDGTVAATQSGTWSVATATYSSSAVSSVTSAATNTVLLASNASRRQAVLYNDCDKAVYVKLGATASSTSFSYRLQPNQTLELPTPVYTGAIDGIWDSSPTGSMRVTEIT